MIILMPKYSVKNLTNKDVNEEIEKLKLKLEESHDERDHKR